MSDLDLLPALLAEHQPQSTLEHHLTAQLAHILAKQTTAEDNETYLLARQPQYLLTHRPDGHLVPDPAYLLYNNRLDALRLHQAGLGREQSRTLRELHRLKRTPLAVKAASEPSAIPSLVTPRLDRGVSGPGAAAAHPQPLMARSRRAMTEVAGAAEAADEPGMVVGAPASEPNAASARTATEPTAPPPASPRLDRGVNGHAANAAHPGPWMAQTSCAKTEVGRAAVSASEPKKPVRTDPVLDDATADRIEAMIASGDIGQLEEAARLLGLLDDNAPSPPGFLEPVKSKLVG